LDIDVVLVYRRLSSLLSLWRQHAGDGPPDNSFAGYNFWEAKLIQFNGDFLKAEMVKAFLSSAEYRSRFGL